MMNRCTVCEGQTLQCCLEFGPQPPSNRFVLPGSPKAEERYPLSLGYCVDCGTVQLVDRMPIEAIRPRFDWLRNNEPEGHLDDLVDKLAGLPGMDPKARIIGLSYKDRSTLERLAKQGFEHVTDIAPAELPAAESPFGLETLQHNLSVPDVIDDLRHRHGAANLLLVRHLVEHAESAARFLAALRGLLAPGGYLVLEFPDNERVLRSANHAFIWEEHFTYFTTASFRALADCVGARLVRFERYPYPFEDALVAVLQFDFTSVRANQPARGTVPGLLAFAERFPVEHVRWHEELSSLKEQGKKLAVFGAGHLAVKLVNFMELAKFIDCVIDDHPRKTGLLMPGSRLPIVRSSDMHARGIRTCISTLSPESEIRVRQKLADYFEDGGRFIPAFQVT